MRNPTGKWLLAGVPHRGWECINIEDLGGVAAVCEMCEIQPIRYVHTMVHDDYPDELACGCICAGHMEQDVDRAKQRERAFKNREKRKKSFLDAHRWRSTARGYHVKKDGYSVTIYRTSRGWMGVVSCPSEPPVYGRKVFARFEDAASAIFDYIDPNGIPPTTPKNAV